MKGQIIIFLFLIAFSSFSQPIRKEKTETFWDQGIPICPNDPYIMQLIYKLGIPLGDSLQDWEKITSKSKAKICREIGVLMYDKGMYDGADWYLTRSKNYKEAEVLEAEVEYKTPALSPSELESVRSDLKFLENLPTSYDNFSKEDMKNLALQIENQLKKLIRERDSLLNSKFVNREVLSTKENTIVSLNKEKKIVDLNIENEELEVQKRKTETYLAWALIFLAILILGILVLVQRKTIRRKDVKIENQLIDLNTKNSYLEHAARLIRHDMHSGINTYIPRGISSLEKRISKEEAAALKIDSSLKMIKEGLAHAQKVYKSVYEFTDLVKENSVLNKDKVNLNEILLTYLATTSYISQVKIEKLVELEVNPVLFCTAIDNLIKNGLKYNDSEEKKIHIYIEKNLLVVQDNGRGLTEKDFEKICFSYAKENKKEERGLGLNISLAILKEHGFELSCEKNEIGTKMKIKIFA